jgi:hypothetical protein
LSRLYHQLSPSHNNVLHSMHRVCFSHCDFLWDPGMKGISESSLSLVLQKKMDEAKWQTRKRGSMQCFFIIACNKEPPLGSSPLPALSTSMGVLGPGCIHLSRWQCFFWERIFGCFWEKQIWEILEKYVFLV